MSGDKLPIVEWLREPRPTSYLDPLAREMWNRDGFEAATTITELVGALEVFVREFEERREAYIRRYPRNPSAGAANFDSMPDEWPMASLTFTMGDLRRAHTALSNTRRDTK